MFRSSYRFPEFVPSNSTSQDNFSNYVITPTVSSSHSQHTYVPSTPNSYENVRDVITLLPEFHPYDGKSLNSNQFIIRVDTLRSAYKWDDHTLIFAVQVLG